MLQSLRHLFPQLLPLPAFSRDALLHEPLLDDAALDGLIRQVQALAGVVQPARDVYYRQAGNERSAFFGRGLDFEEVRLYQRGDELRDMDWRTTARTGKPYLKIYREEHQPALHVVVDRSAGMRFGTKKLLKVTQAARIAACYAFAAMRENTRIGGTIWQPGAISLPGVNGEEGAMRLVRAAIAPCPPLAPSDSRKAHALPELLRELDVLLQRGTRLVLISDFADLHERDLPLLMRLAQHHQLLAIQVSDPAEQTLPDVGMVQFQDMTSGTLRWLDTGARSERSAFMLRAEASQALRRQMFERIGVRLQQCGTDEDAFRFYVKVSGYE